MNKSLVIVGIVSSLVTCLFMYIDARLFDTPRSKFTYFKNMVLVSTISVAIVYFMGPSNGPKLQLGGVAPVNTSLVGEQEIFTGVPHF